VQAGKKKANVGEKESIYLRDPRRCRCCGTRNPSKHCPCKGADYCDDTCQKDDWDSHKRTCPWWMEKQLSYLTDPMELGCMSLEIADVYIMQFEYPLAEWHLKQAIREAGKAMHSPTVAKSGGPGRGMSVHRLLAMAWENLGFIYHARGRLSQALMAQNTAVENWKHEDGTNRSCCVKVFSGMVNTYLGKGEVSMAYDLAEVCLDIVEHSRAMCPLNKGVTLYTMGNVYEHMGDSENAMKYCAHAHRIFEKHNKNWFHVSLHVKALVLIADIHRKRGDYTKALSLYFMALEISKEFYGFKHPQVTMILNYVADTMKRRGDKGDEPRLIATKSLKTTRALFGEDHWQTALPMGLLADIMQQRGMSADIMQKRREYQKAIFLFTDAIEIVKKHSSSPRLVLAEWYYKLAFVYEQVGDLRNMMDALEHSRESPIEDPELVDMVEEAIARARSVTQPDAQN